jgi:hypothetical protein
MTDLFPEEIGQDRLNSPEIPDSSTEEQEFEKVAKQLERKDRRKRK